MVVIATFYKFVSLPDLDTQQENLRSLCQALQLKGTILLAQEGINATLAGTQDAIAQFFATLRRDPRFADVVPRESSAEVPPFDRMKVRQRAEIVPLGVPEISPAEQVGIYVSPEEWNQLLADPEVTVIDTRNDYEVAIGTFHHAQNPQTQTFREFPDYVHHHLNPQQHKKVAMFCTGGIRCEKASAYLMAQGFEEVYHLKGGILNYLETIPAKDSLWRGECFVFDQRVAVTHGLAIGSHGMCMACGHPISEADQLAPTYEEGVSCPHCFEDLTAEQKAHNREKQRAQRRSPPAG